MNKDKGQANATKAVKLSTLELLGYGVGNMAQNMAFLMVSLYLLYFYTDVFKIHAVAAGTILLIIRLIDGAYNPVVGIIADRTNTKWGSFRPYILFGTIPLAVFTVLSFTAPEFSDKGKIIYAFITYLFQSLAYSTVFVSYVSITPVMTQDPDERTKVQTINLVLASIAMVIISVGTKPFVAMFSNEKTGYLFTVMGYMTVAAIFFLVCFASVKERVLKTADNHYSLKETFKLIGSNGPLLIVALAYIFYSMTFSVRMSALLYYFKYNIGNEGLIAIFMLVLVVASLGGTVVTLPLTKAIGKRNSYLIGTLIAIITSLTFGFIPYSNIPMIFVVGALMVIASQIPLVCHWAMVPDTVDYGEWKSGKRGEGVTYGLVTFSQKLGSAIGAAITGLILSLSGYVPNVVQTEKALTGIMHLMVTLPLICYVICLALYYFYKLDRKTFDKILQEISDRQVAG